MSQTSPKQVHPLLQKANGYLATLDKELSKSSQLCLIEEKTKIPKSYMVSGSVGLVFLLIFFNVWGNLLTNLIGFVYPAYASFKAIETDNKEDDTQWLIYWTIFGLLNVVEFFSDLILHWVPFYYTFKAAAVLYLALPQTRGASVVYHKFARPYLVKQEKGLDEAINKIKKSAEDAIKDVKSAAEKKDE
ncbi:ER membrane protein DP1/Yop1 [Lobulomyces angularis]|nr:ER membrane protein DP1/Yop1 [Lobulomyces angularis]